MKLTLFALIALSLTSCAEHQYLTLSGINIDKDDNHEFVIENDTLKLVYHFKPDQGRIFVSIFNRTDEPMVIDWWKSAIIVGNKTYSFYNPNARMNGQIDADTSNVRKTVSGGSSVYFADVNGTVHLNETSQFIPSHAQISKELFVLKLDTLKNLPEKLAKRDTIPVSSGATIAYRQKIPFRRMSFERDSSPLNFRSYLTFRIGKGRLEKEFSLEHKFYVSEVWKIAASLKEIPASITTRGDMIYLAR